jgi:Cu(I)/Ag(I) efflux system membrane fusion protein
MTMSHDQNDRIQKIALPSEPMDEGGLRAPLGLSLGGKIWWWFHFLILLKLARLRFIGLLVAIGLVIVKWDTLIAYYDRWTRPAAETSHVDSQTEYFCPMHPTVIRDNPKEKCPICFMPLSKRKKGEAVTESLPAGIANRVQLSPYRVVQAGIHTSTVEYVPLTKEIRTVGTVEFNERGLKHIAARVKGRIDDLYVSETGQTVEAGDELASLYSPDLVVTMQNLLDAQRSGNKDLLRNTAERLSLWGISDDQIQTILQTGKSNTHLKIRTPITGHVIRKYVKEGQYVDEGSPLYDVADLSTVWVQAQVYEEDIAFLGFQPHQHNRRLKEEVKIPVTATTRTAPGEIFSGTISFVFPHVDQDSRTLTIRFELANPGHKLRPGTTANVTIRPSLSLIPFLNKNANERWMQETAASSALQAIGMNGMGIDLLPMLKFAEQIAAIQSGQMLAVPESAVIDTGSQQIVYREILPGQYEGVKVVLGPRMIGRDGVQYYPILKGLEDGDRVVTSGSFLLDAETRLNPAAGSIYFGGSSGNSKGQAVTASSVRPSTPEDDDLKFRALLAKLSSADRRIAEAQGYCAIRPSNRLGSMGRPIKVILEGQTVFLCCGACEADARAKPANTVSKANELRARDKNQSPKASPSPSGLSPSEMAEIHASLAQLKGDDRAIAESQRLCPVNGKPLGSMGVPSKVMLNGQTVFLCCDGCDDRALAEPEKMLTKIKSYRTKLQSEKK